MEKLKRWYYFKAARLLRAMIEMLYKPYSIIKSRGVELDYWDDRVVSCTLAEKFGRELPLTGKTKIVADAFAATTEIQGESHG